MKRLYLFILLLGFCGLAHASKITCYFPEGRTWTATGTLTVTSSYTGYYHFTDAQGYIYLAPVNKCFVAYN